MHVLCLAVSEASRTTNEESRTTNEVSRTIVTKNSSCQIPLEVFLRYLFYPNSTSLDKKDLNVQTFAENRANEVRALSEVVKDVGGNHQAFQKLPRHMRRRAMSHNIKRVPRRLHEQVKSEIEKTKAPNKRPSRRYRRRPGNLLSEYERRKRKISWLETHIWHAKRFLMANRWGYHVAIQPNDKSVRACYRAVKRHCLMQDVSYETCIELKGLRRNILDGLAHLTSADIGLTFASKMTSLGTRQGYVMLYEYDSYPHNAIGLVSFFWCAHAENDKESNTSQHSALSTLWLSCHPSFLEKALKEIRKCFAEDSSKRDLSSNSSENVDVSSTLTSNPSQVCVTSLKDQLVKFRLYGPASNHVLAETLQIASIDSSKVQDLTVGQDAASSAKQEKESVNGNKRNDMSQPSPWWKNVYSNEFQRKNFLTQTEMWSRIKQCQSPAELPPHCLIALTVRDPRLLIPPRRNKVSVFRRESLASSIPAELFTPEVSCSSLWDADVRDKVKSTKISECKLNELKGKQLVPGSTLDLGDEESRIPVILSQRPGCSTDQGCSMGVSLGYGCGWDVYIPAGWAMAFWVALVYQGVRVGGVREARSIALQAQQLAVPFDFPDTAAGEHEIGRESGDLQTRHDRRPPAKRLNHIKLGFPSAYTFQFDSVSSEWKGKWEKMVLQLQKDTESKGNGFYIMRERRTLQLLSMALQDKKAFRKQTNALCKDNKHGRNSEDILSKLLSHKHGKKLSENPFQMFVPVQMVLLHRGVPARHGHICMPSLEDLKKLDTDKTFGGPEEPMHPDPDESTRKEERKERLRLRRRKKRGKTGKHQEETKLAVTMDNVNVKEKELSSSNDNSHVNATSVKPLHEHLSRSVMGFIVNGTFDLGQGQGSGIGFCNVAALLSLLNEQKERNKCTVLVRNTTSVQYRFSSISVLC